jgi:hypothetical protein
MACRNGAVGEPGGVASVSPPLEREKEGAVRREAGKV